MGLGVVMAKRKSPAGELLRKKIWYLLKSHGEMSLGEILEAVSDPLERVEHILQRMQSTGLVVQLPDERYALGSPGRGGARDGAGRPRQNPDERLMDSRTTITLRAADLAWAREHGGSRQEVSKGVRYAIAVAREMERRGALPDVDEEKETE